MTNGLRKKPRRKQHLTVATNNISYHGVTLTKPVKDMYDDNFKSLKKFD